jgi:hypothetical protein
MSEVLDGRTDERTDESAGVDEVPDEAAGAGTPLTKKNVKIFNSAFAKLPYLVIFS